MSTTYYRLRRPVTRLGEIPQGSHSRVTIWVNHGNAGTVTLRKDEVDGFCRTFTGEPVLTISAGPEETTRWTILTSGHIWNDEQLISENGDLTTMELLRNFHNVPLEEVTAR